MKEQKLTYVSTKYTTIIYGNLNTTGKFLYIHVISYNYALTYIFDLTHVIIEGKIFHGDAVRYKWVLGVVF